MKYHVTGIGNPLLDLTLKVDEKFLKEVGIKKGSMQLIDKAQSEKIRETIKAYEIKVSPGGSAANTLAGVSAMGGKSAFIGKIGQDKHGDIYHEETKKAGTDPRLSKHESEITGHAITFITPDGERTFAVHLGAATHLDSCDLCHNSIKDSHFLHIEGFKLEDSKLKKTIEHAVETAKKNQTKISLDLSDSELVKRNIDHITNFVKNHVDIVFANEEEAKAFTGKEEHDALHHIHEMCDISIVKLGKKGSLIKVKDAVHEIPAHKTMVENLNGAGDMYAAGILYGLANGMPIEKAGTMASYAASLVVGRSDARVNTDLSHIVITNNN